MLKAKDLNRHDFCPLEEVTLLDDIYVEGYGSVSDTVDLMKLLSSVFSETNANTEDSEQN